MTESYPSPYRRVGDTRQRALSAPSARPGRRAGPAEPAGQLPSNRIAAEDEPLNCRGIGGRRHRRASRRRDNDAVRGGCFAVIERRSGAAFGPVLRRWSTQSREAVNDLRPAHGALVDDPERSRVHGPPSAPIRTGGLSGYVARLWRAFARFSVAGGAPARLLVQRRVVVWCRPQRLGSWIAPQSHLATRRLRSTIRITSLGTTHGTTAGMKTVLMRQARDCGLKMGFRIQQVFDRGLTTESMIRQRPASIAPLASLRRRRRAGYLPLVRSRRLRRADGRERRIPRR